MTEPSEPAVEAVERPARARRKPSPLPVFIATAALFAGVMGVLGVRMAAGQDPALGATKPKAAAVQPGRRIIVRKVIVTRHVTVIEPAPATASPGSGAGSSPAQDSTALAQAPAPAPAPAGRAYTPPPAPAPVVTATS